MRPALPCFVACFVALSLARAAEEPPPQEKLPVGEVHQVAIDDEGKITYHCYLPKGYDAARRYPVVYGFSPGDASGGQPAEQWAEAADKHGWVVAWDDRSSTGRFTAEDLKKQAETLMADVEKRVSVYAGRCYATGFAAGARRAVAVARAFPEKFAGVLVVGGFAPPLQLDHPKTLVVFATAGTKDPNLRELRAFKEQFDKDGIPFELRTFDGAAVPPPNRLLDEGAEWLTRMWFRLHDDPSPEGRRERLAAATEMLDAIQNTLKEGDRSGAYEEALKLQQTFSNTTDDKLKTLLAEAGKLIAELEKDPSVAGMKAYKPPVPAAVLDAFAQAVEANAQLAPEAKAKAKALIAQARKDPSQAQDAMVQALAALYPAFGDAYAAFQDEQPGAAAALAKLRDAADVYLAAHAAYFEGRAHLMAERYEDALPLLAKVAGPWIDKTLFSGESLFLVGICQAELFRREAALRILRDFIKNYPDAPERMRVGADHVARVLEWTQEGSLADVHDRMDDSRRRLALERSGKPTQDQQGRVIAYLDRLIEEAEQQQQQGGGGGGGGGQGQGGPPSGNQVPGGPANSSSAPGGQTRIGALDRATRGRPDEVWGNARQREREKVLNVLKAKFPERYRELLEQYYKSLQEGQR